MASERLTDAELAEMREHVDSLSAVRLREMVTGWVPRLLDEVEAMRAERDKAHAAFRAILDRRDADIVAARANGLDYLTVRQAVDDYNHDEISYGRLVELCRLAANAVAEQRIVGLESCNHARRAAEDECEGLRAELADIRTRLDGHPDSRLDGEGGLAAATMRELRRLGDVVERLVSK